MSDFYPATLARTRRLMLGLLALGLCGTTLELWLMGHYEDVWQRAPLVATATAGLSAAWVAAGWSPAATRVFRVVMVALVLVGLTGAVMHIRANMEFQLEMDPSLGGWPLWREVLHAKAPPALAPGNMALLGLLGLLSVWRVEWTSPD